MRSGYCCQQRSRPSDDFEIFRQRRLRQRRQLTDGCCTHESLVDVDVAGNEEVHTVLVSHVINRGEVHSWLHVPALCNHHKLDQNRGRGSVSLAKMCMQKMVMVEVPRSRGQEGSRRCVVCCAHCARSRRPRAPCRGWRWPWPGPPPACRRTPPAHKRFPVRPFGCTDERTALIASSAPRGASTRR